MSGSGPDPSTGDPSNPAQFASARSARDSDVPDAVTTKLLKGSTHLRRAAIKGSNAWARAARR